jgi:STE24 endopeptidase
MNAYGLVILAALVLAQALDLLADALDLRALDPAVPPEFRDVYDGERYRRAHAYTRVRSHLGMVAGTAMLALLLGFWFAGGFAALDRAVRGLGLGPVASGLLFIGALGLGRTLAGLPFRWWATFVVEARFGFNRTTAATFAADVAKQLALGAAIGAPLLAAVLWLFAHAGPFAWLWAWGVGAAALVGVQLVVPAWILPLFNRFTPLADGGLREAILRYARSVAFPLDGVFVVDGSRRSTKGNAFFTGLGRRKRIGLFDTLLERLSPPEVVAVVAHEVGHWVRGHVAEGITIGIAHLGLLLALLSVFVDRPGLYEAFFLDARPLHAGLVFFTILATPLDRVVSLLLHARSRRNEYAADAFAAATTGTPGALASALVRLSADALANLTPHPLYVALHHSHPPVLARVRALTEPARR